MEIKNKKALVLGGAGLVGRAICRQLIMQDIDSIIICSLFQQEAEEFTEQLEKEYPQIKFEAVWGDVFLRWEHKDVSRSDILNKQDYRDAFLHDILNPLDKKILTGSSIFNLLKTHKPDIVIDAMNTASILAYQNIFGSAKETYSAIQNINDETKNVVEKLLCTQYIPQLIRHIQIFQQSMLEHETRVYLKIGTCGTGGMGLNIPYTHSEDRPSRMLLAKSAVAGAHSLLLFLMARTPGGPIIKELKPAAAIAWKKVGHGPVKKKGQPIMMEDIQINEALNLEGELSKTLQREASYLTQDDKPRNLEAPYIDTGENGLFSLGEFETLTDEGQMEFITPEEIAQNAIWEIMGGNTGTDIVAAFDNSILGPTYRAGYMRHGAIQSLRDLVEKTGTESVAFELLGPPRLSKLLYEAFLLKKVFKTFNGVLETAPQNMTECVEELVKNDAELRSSIVSIGIPVLLSSNQLLRGQRMAIPADIPGNPKAKFEINDENINNWATDGWVDLRVQNMNAWQKRFQKIKNMINSIPENDSSSCFAKGIHYWDVENGDMPISISKLASWIFIHEDQGKRMK